MLISYNWIKSYFKGSFPTPEKLSELLTMGVFEIDLMEKRGDDTVLDVKTLADRNPYALSHRYIALEIGALLRQKAEFPETKHVEVTNNKKPNVVIEDADFCSQYVTSYVEAITITESPVWVKERFEVLGQRSINSVVDATNYIMLYTGQPLHAFDADKVVGTIHVRKAKDAEEITLLDGTVVKLTSSMHVIADDEGPLAIAGVKGGKKAEVTVSTKNLILESATFNASQVRKTAQAVGIRNESTKRFENQITLERALWAMKELQAFLFAQHTEAKFGEIVTVGNAVIEKRTLTIDPAYITRRLGIEISTKEIIEILHWCAIEVKKDIKEGGSQLVLTIPAYRSDLVIAEDIIEEVGRIYGYDKIPGVLPPPVSTRHINKEFYYRNLIRKTFVDMGFSEISTYTLVDHGDTQILNPLNVNRGFMRDSLVENMQEKLEHNVRYADLLGLTEIKLFEIGNIFGGGVTNERVSLVFGVGYQKLSPSIKSLQEITQSLSKVVSSELVSKTAEYKTNITDKYIANAENLKRDIGIFVYPYVLCEIDLAKVIESLPQPTTDIEFAPLAPIKFKQYSPYPFAVRDIAVFVPKVGDAKNDLEVMAIITNEAGALLVRATLFDVFEKTFKDTGEVKVSYAYRLVFQAQDRTLTEDDLNSIMKRITDTMNAKAGWQVR